MSKRYSLLFVDDEKRVLRSLNSVFRREYDVYLADSGFQALEILYSKNIDVIVSDQRMPHMTGSELLAKVHEQYPQVMRVLLTGYVDKEAIINTINEGEIFRFISKPWNITEIKNIIAEAASASDYKVPTTLANEKSIALEDEVPTALDVKKPTAKNEELSSKDDTIPNGPDNFLHKNKEITENKKSTTSKSSTNATEVRERLIRAKSELATDKEDKPREEISSSKVKEKDSEYISSSEKFTLGPERLRTDAAKTAFVLMEKDQSVRNTIRSLSKKHRFAVYAIGTYMQAVRTLSIRPDVGVAIISIADKPAETLEALNVIKQHHPNLIVIILAEMTDATVAIRLINEGQVFRYLQKPLSEEEFERVVKSAISRHQLLKDIDGLNKRYKAGFFSGTMTGIQKLKRLFKKSA
jgi:DNA-binding NtrC family response regulator